MRRRRSSSSSSDDESPCFRCGRYGHWVADCYAKTDVDGVKISYKKKKKSGVYAIGDASGKIYVGKSSNIDARVQQHASGAGTSFLSGVEKRPTITVSGDDLESRERNETLAQMYQNGIQNVRGWMFTTPVLTSRQTEDAFHQICEKFDLCRKCGRQGHFIKQCYAKEKADWAKNT